MENAIQNSLNELGEWYDICSIKAILDIETAKVDIYDIMAMMECLKTLDLLRASEEELEM